MYVYIRKLVLVEMNLERIRHDVTRSYATVTSSSLRATQRRASAYFLKQVVDDASVRCVSHRWKFQPVKNKRKTRRNSVKFLTFFLLSRLHQPLLLLLSLRCFFFLNLSLFVFLQRKRSHIRNSSQVDANERTHLLASDDRIAEAFELLETLLQTKLLLLFAEMLCESCRHASNFCQPCLQLLDQTSCRLQQQNTSFTVNVTWHVLLISFLFKTSEKTYKNRLQSKELCNEENITGPDSAS